MVRVLIVARTEMGPGAVCVGGLNLETNQNIRLYGPGGMKLPLDVKFNVKHIVVGGKESAGRRPLPDDQLAPRSLYIREYKRRKAAEKKRQML